ncbi:KR domain-containing protein [Usnea florida]
MCGRCNKNLDVSSNDEPSRQSAPEICHQASPDDREYEPIAIIGMGCWLPGGASSLSKLWDLPQRLVLRTARSQTLKVTATVSASNTLSLQDRVATLSSQDTRSVSLRDLSHTLGSRQSHLPIRGYITVNGQESRGGLRLDNFHTSDVNSRYTQLPYAFIFSGQGAQWQEMGLQLLDRYPFFGSIIRDLVCPIHLIFQSMSSVTLLAQGIFTRMLRTDGKAYHSPYMFTVGKQYEGLIEDVLTKESRCWLDKRRDSKIKSRVLFKAAIETLAPAPIAFDFIEVSPHPVLEVPVKQTLAKTSPIFYTSTLSRGKDGTRGQRFCAIYPLTNGSTTPSLDRIPIKRKVSPSTPQELLGTRVFNGCSLTGTWRKMLSADNVQYAGDRKLGSAIVFPGAGYLSMALEASCQLTNSTGVHCATLFRHVHILKALTITSTGTIELFTELRPASISNVRMSIDSWEVTILCVYTKDTVTHAKGLVQIDKTVHPVNFSRPQISDSLELQAMRTVYDEWATRGLVFDPRFQSLTEMYFPRAKGHRTAMAKTHLRTCEDPEFLHKSEYRVHPITLDAVFQTELIADTAGSVENLCAGIPVSIDYVHIANSLMLSETGTAYAKARRALTQNSPSYRSGVPGQALDALSTCLDLIAHNRSTIRILDLTDEMTTVTDSLLDGLHTETLFKRFQTYTLGSVDGRGQLLGRQIRRAPEERNETTQRLALASDAEFDVFVLPTVRGHEFVATPIDTLIDYIRRHEPMTPLPDTVFSCGARSRDEQPSTELIAFDVDDFVSNPNKVASHIVDVLDQSLHNPAPENEYIYRHGIVHVSCLMADEELNRDFRQGWRATRITTTWEQASRCQLAIDLMGQLDTIHSEQAPAPKSQLRADFVEVQVKSVGLNAKLNLYEDYYALSGKLDTKDSTCTSEYCGVITTVGSAVVDLAPRDRVVVAAPGHFKAHERVPMWACQKLRIEEDFAMVLAFSPASVLIHSASGSASLAAIQIAKLTGAEIYATVGTAQRKQFLIQSMGVKPGNIFIREAINGRGVDVVFNSLTGEMLHDSFRALAPFGRFVETVKRDILESRKLDLGIFKRGATFTAIDLTHNFYSSNPAHHHLWHRLCSRVLELYRAQQVTGIRPLKVFAVSDIQQALQYVSPSKRIGKVVVSLDDPTSCIKFRPPRYTTVLSPLKSYTMWMFDRGAQSFVFLGRSGADKPTAKKLVEDLQKSDAAVVVVRGDVSCLEDVQKAVMHSDCPIGGLVQATMGLNEAIFTDMSEEFWHTGIDAKVLGTWNLHTAMAGKDDQLDFLIVTSSVSGTIGSATEGNCCAGKHFLDDITRYRRNLGLPATSIGLGMISEAQRDQSFNGRLQVFDNPRTSILLQSFNETSSQPSGSTSVGKSLSRKLREAVQSGGDLRQTIHDVIRGKMANLILLPTNEINAETTLSTFGMDSMLAAELRTYIYQASAVDVPFQTIMGDTTSISSLADTIAEEITQDQRQ